jgi:inner membrane protein involved in colicin E2 resistance
MDREKDIGPICNIYEDKNIKYDNNKMNSTNEDRISDIGNSIRDSLINDKKRSTVCSIVCSNEVKSYLNLLKLFLFLGILIIGIYFFAIYVF